MRWRVALLVALACGPGTAQTVLPGAGEVVRARLTQPTLRYDHQVFGDRPLSGGMKITVNTCIGCAGLQLSEVRITLPPTHVFEDITARVADLDGDGRAEVVVVETDMARGATLAVYDARGKRAATAPVGQTHRWLAPAGIGDFDGDGRVEIAYVDRPHLARELVFLRYDAGTLTELFRAPGYTNHRFGEAEIQGGVRSCAGQDEVVLASGDWRRVVAVRRAAAGVVARDLGPFTADADLRAALQCRKRSVDPALRDEGQGGHRHALLDQAAGLVRAGLAVDRPLRRVPRMDAPRFADEFKADIFRVVLDMAAQLFQRGGAVRIGASPLGAASIGPRRR